MFNPVTPYRYLFPKMYLSVADISNPDILGCNCRTLISLDITRFYEEQWQPSSLKKKKILFDNNVTLTYIFNNVSPNKIISFIKRAVLYTLYLIYCTVEKNVILMGFLLFSALIDSGEHCSSSLVLFGI